MQNNQHKEPTRKLYKPKWDNNKNNNKNKNNKKQQQLQQLQHQQTEITAKTTTKTTTTKQIPCVVTQLKLTWFLSNIKSDKFRFTEMSHRTIIELSKVKSLININIFWFCWIDLGIQ